MTGKAIGAETMAYYKDEGQEQAFSAYFSFGEYDEETETDNHGVPDFRIFFYVEGEEDMRSLSVPGAEDFVVLSYDIVYQG